MANLHIIKISNLYATGPIRNCESSWYKMCTILRRPILAGVSLFNQMISSCYCIGIDLSGNICLDTDSNNYVNPRFHSGNSQGSQCPTLSAQNDSDSQKPLVWP